MALTSINSFINRASAGYTQTFLLWEERQTAKQNLFATISPALEYITSITLPALPTGVTSYIPLHATWFSGNVRTPFFAKMIHFGTIDISGASGTWTGTGNTMGTRTELGVSNNVYGPLIGIVKTALNSAPGSLNVTYVDDAGNAAEAAPAIALTASSAVKSAGLVRLNRTGNTGDRGVRSVSTVTRTSGTTPTGEVDLYGLIPIVGFDNVGTGVGGFVSCLTTNFHPIRLTAGDVIGVFSYGTTTLAAQAGLGHFTIIGED